MDIGGVLVGIVSLFVLIAVNAFFVFAEYSLAVSRKTRIMELAEQGHAGARVVLRVMEDPDRFFAATQIGVTLTSLAVGVVSEPAFAHLFAHLLGGLVWTPLADLSGFMGAVIGLIIASFFQIVLAELVPRSITLRSAERIALAVVGPMNALAGLLRPAIWVLKSASRLTLRALGYRTQAGDERLYSIDELRMLVAASQKGGLIESDQRDMLDAVFSFGDLSVREVMVPRTELVCVEVDSPLERVAHVLAAHPVSRLPVYEESLDNIVGVLHSKDMMRALLPGAKPMTVRQLMRPALFVPDSQRADELLQQFRRHRQTMAIVLDEYGGTAGIVTLSDLLAEIVGEVGESPAERPPDVQKMPDGSALINGLATLNDVNEALGLRLRDEHVETIGGYVMSCLGRIPKAGDEVHIDSENACLRVEEMDKLRVARVRFMRLPVTPTTASSPPAAAEE
ncbi:MAG: hemolysin family protein [Anaerolineae bacterium]|nr:hemolysin family protein [Thermoflexales bacterium]MDW8408009.1 hemolysin family protein [Anaerolineae bacterium]